MKIQVLGSAAGGGFPQWNCNCFNCDGVRRGSIDALPRTQSSIAITENTEDWVLVNASPDLLAQIKSVPALQPARAVRDSGIVAVLLMDAQIDHVTGLLMLRERGSPLPLYATEEVMADLNNGLNIGRALGHYCGLDWRPIVPDRGDFKIAPLQRTDERGGMLGMADRRIDDVRARVGRQIECRLSDVRRLGVERRCADPVPVFGRGDFRGVGVKERAALRLDERVGDRGRLASARQAEDDVGALLELRGGRRHRLRLAVSPCPALGCIERGRDRLRFCHQLGDL